MRREQPNVLLLFTDQQRADTIAALGNAVIRTPALDRLCTVGTAFTSAYTPAPVCVPARACMLYGQDASRTGCTNNREPMPEDGRFSFVDALTRAGYRTHAVGKCHFTPDPQAMRGFQTRERQEEVVASPDEDDYLKFLHDRGFAHVCDPHGVRGETYYLPQVAQMPAELHPTRWVGDRAVRFLDEEATRAGPWFLFASFIHPHPPLAVPNPWHMLYRPRHMPLPHAPENSEALRTHVNTLQNALKFRDGGEDRHLLRAMRAYYYAAISFVDRQVGRILDAVERVGQADHTLILFASDHGEYLGDYGCFGKRGMHDASARVPLIACRAARFPVGGRCDSPVSLLDLAPTILAAADVALETDLDGLDLADTAAGATRREAIFSRFARGPLANYMALTDRWKYVFHATEGRELLFDRRNDPLETRNRAGEGCCAAPLAEMRARLIGHLRSRGATDALDGDRLRVYSPRDLPDRPNVGPRVHDHPWANVTLPG